MSAVLESTGLATDEPDNIHDVIDRRFAGICNDGARLAASLDHWSGQARGQLAGIGNARDGWRHGDLIDAIAALSLRGDAERRSAIHRGAVPKSRDDQADRHGRELLAALLGSPKSFAEQLRQLHQVLLLEGRLLTDKAAICAAEFKHAAGHLIDPMASRINRRSGREATQDLIDSERKLDRTKTAQGLLNRLLTDYPTTLGTGLADLFGDVPDLDAALFSARLIVEQFPAGPLQAIQARVRDVRASLAASGEPSSLEVRILAGLELQAADIDGVQDPELSSLAASRTALLAKIQRLDKLAADAGLDAGAELGQLRKELKVAEKAIETRRAALPKFPKVVELRERAIGGDLNAVGTIHKYASILPGAFPSGLAGAIREVCVEALLASGFAAWARASANIWAV